MGKDRVRNASAVINIVAMITILIGYVLEKIRIELNTVFGMVLFLILLIFGVAILNTLKETKKYCIFLYGTLNFGLIMLVESIFQIISMKINFISIEIISVVLLFILTIINKIYLKINDKRFLQKSILLSFVAIIYAVTIYDLKVPLSIAINSIFIIVVAVSIILDDIWKKLFSNVDVYSDMIVFFYACIICTAIIATSFKNLNGILTLSPPSIIIIFIIYVFRKEILTIFGEGNFIIVLSYSVIMLSLPIAIVIQLYSNILLYKILIATLLIITSFLLLILSGDNMNIVMENKKLDRIVIERKLSKVRMLVGNTAIFLTIVSVIIDNFYDKFDSITRLESYKGTVFAIIIWLSGAIFSKVFIDIERKALKTIVKFINEEK